MYPARKRSASLLAFAVSAICAFAVPLAASEYRDLDWNTSLFTTCRLPCTIQTDDRPSSTEWLTNGRNRKLSITLAPGDVGGCSSDRDARDGAPFWERAELTNSAILQSGTRHSISFEAEFPRGFNGKRETFFQIHGWSKTCPSAPLMMLQFDWQSLQAKVLKLVDEEDFFMENPRGDLVQVLKDKPKISDMRNGVNSFEVQFDRTVTPPTVSLSVNGKSMLTDEPIHMVSCAEPRFKIGIYRPGEINVATSQVIFDKVTAIGPKEPVCAPNS